MNTPTITADSLCEYLATPASRRLALLERSKYRALFADPFEQARALAINVLLGQDVETARAIADLSSHGSMAALAFCVSWSRTPCLFDVRPSPPVSIEIGSVLVTDAGPHVLLEGDFSGMRHHGGLALYFGPAGERVAQIRNALMMRAIASAAVDPLVTVVLSANRQTAVRGFAPIANREIKDACAEIVSIWPTI